MLLENAADITIENNKGQTALGVAKQHGRTGIVKLINDFVNKRQKEVSAAVLEARPEVAKVLAEEISEFETEIDPPEPGFGPLWP